jgi:two-component system, LytTR family, response regulator
MSEGPRTLGRYRITGEIGKGGMGVVYRATDMRLGREVALKVLAPGPGDDPERERRLRLEARAAAALTHPSICVVYEIDESDGATFIAMELVRGTPLSALVPGGMSAPRALDLAIEMAEGLAEAHAHGIVHRDLKPSNVMVTDSGRAKLIDFGLAKHWKPPESLDSDMDTPAGARTDPGRLIGTAAYMSPEQVRGQGVDPRSDIFSFGSVLFEMLSGVCAFRRETGVETLHAVLKEPSPRLSSVGLGGTVPEIERVIERCLAKDPAQRYAGVPELLADLRAARDRLDEPGAAAEVQAPLAAPPQAPGPGEPLRVLVVDDEDPARAILVEYLGREEALTVVGECRNGFEAVKAVAQLHPHLVFLDVQMPKLSGFEVLELIGREVAVVFVTAFDEYALRAFEVNAVDYLQKPVAPERLAAAVRRARERLGARVPLPAPEPIARAAQPPDAKVERLVVRQGPNVVVIALADLDYADAQDDYVGLHTRGKSYLKPQTLSDLETSLDPKRFVRIHRSYILNIDRLAKLESEGGEVRSALLTDGTRLPVSRSGYARLKTLL